MPFVLTPKQAEVVRRGLERLGFSFDEAAVSGYVVLYNLRKPYHDLKLSTVAMEAHATESPEKAGLAIDHDLHTRWPTAKPQAKGMEFSVIFSEPRRIRGIAYCLGEWAHDYPRGLEIQALKTDGTSDVVFSAEDYAAVSYLSFSHYDCESDLVLSVPPEPVTGFRFIETGSHPVLDWSIAELRFYE